MRTKGGLQLVGDSAANTFGFSQVCRRSAEAKHTVCRSGGSIARLGKATWTYGKRLGPDDLQLLSYKALNQRERVRLD
ncbi:hypothetical protein RRG08_045777 [Elysia crispata]|uniref:Uncharacterized protein n=1 Tax=Elysia crispata TaxID=231223 RepID=A0AAE1E7W7_9GAST|nr:hypothetical protein RRG08_045777 [Elysia crispata]